MNNIAIIPARSGSKGLKNKNIMDLCGKPMLAYSIEAALYSNEFSEVMVSTDSDLYADIAMKYGASVPFLRSERTSADDASSWDMVEEVLNGYKEKNREFDSFCLLQPTSPLRTASDIKRAYRLYREKAELAVVSVCEVDHSPLWCGQLPKSRELTDFIDQSAVSQRQKQRQFYRLNGAIYIVNTTCFKEDKFIYKKGSFAYIMSQEHSIDIDTELDYKIARVIMEEKNHFPGVNQ